MAMDMRSELQRPFTVAVAAIAVVGWLIAGVSMWRSSTASSAAAVQVRQLETRVADGQATLEKTRREHGDASGKLQTALDKASHEREEVARQLAAAQGKLAEAQAATTALHHERDETQAQLRTARQEVA